MTIQMIDHDVGTILATLQRIYGVETEQDVFVHAFKNQGMGEALNEYRIFVLNDRQYLPACVQCEYLQCLRTVPP